MHISEGILTGPVLGAGAVLTLAGVAVGLRKIETAQIPRTAVLTAAFFAASLIHIPLGPSSVHLVLNGLMGVILGWAAFPALLTGLFLQALIFGYGGLTVLGVNTFNMAFPAVAVFYLGRIGRKSNNLKIVFALGFAAGACSVFLSGLLMALSLLLAGKEFLPLAAGALVAHLPLMMIEGLVTGSAILFLRRVRPEIFRLPDKITLIKGESAYADPQP